MSVLSHCIHDWLLTRTLNLVYNICIMLQIQVHRINIIKLLRRAPFYSYYPSYIGIAMK